jgi:hypothetical protein
VSGTSLGRRYWQALTDAPRGEPPAAPGRGRAGYTLSQRYWAALFNVWLPPRDVGPDVPALGDPVSEPQVDGFRVRLPRFDRAAVHYAATAETPRASADWTVGDRRFVLRESGPDQLDLLVTTQHRVPPAEVLPIEVRGQDGTRRLLMAFVPDPGGGSIGVLRLFGEADWLDVTAEDPLSATSLSGADPAVRDQLFDSVRATPDPGMPAWEAIREARAPGDPLRQVIIDAAR